MSRIRTIKPEFYRHIDLFEAEQTCALPLRLAFTGLLTCCDREGRFKWRPRQLKLDVLPYDDLDFEQVLNALSEYGFIVKYDVNHELYGYFPSWANHQMPSRDELPSEIPTPDGDITHYDRPPTYTLRLRIYARDNHTCVYCSEYLKDKPRSICLDHVISPLFHGTHRETNLATCCKKCHARKGNQTPAECQLPWPAKLGEIYDKGKQVAIHDQDALQHLLTLKTHPVTLILHTPLTESETCPTPGQPLVNRALGKSNDTVNFQLDHRTLPDNVPLTSTSPPVDPALTGCFTHLTGGQQFPDKERELDRELELEREMKLKNTSMSGKPDDDSLATKNSFANAPSLSLQTSTAFRTQALEVLQFLNEKTGRTYRPVDTNLKLIVARLKSGASVMDCSQVIAKKTREWKDDPKMAEYLRPATLFNATKFEQYFGELLPEPAEEEEP